MVGYSPFWVAGRIDGTTSIPTVVTRKGDKGTQITCVRHAGRTVCVYDVSWTTAHPDGANHVVMICGEGNSYNETLGGSATGYTNTSTGFVSIFRRLYSQPSGASEGLIDCPFTFFVLK